MSVDSSNPFFLFTDCPQPVLVYSPDCSVIDANKAALAFFQRSKPKLLKLTGLDLHATEDKEEYLAELNERRIVSRRRCKFSTDAGVRVAETCSYPIVAGGIEARVEMIIRSKPDAAPMKWRFMYSRLIKTLEAMPVGFYLLDRNWKVVYWNAQAEAIFGINREQVLGKALWAVFPEAVNSKFYLEYTQAMETGTPVNFEEYYWPLQKWGRVDVNPIDDGLAVFFTDISAYRAAEDALKDNLEELREVSFVHSHLMRRPVANILGLSQLLDGQELSGTMQELNALLQQSIRELDEIIVESNSRINSQQDNTSIQARLNVEVFHFDELVREVIDQYANQFPKCSYFANCDADIEFSGNRQAITRLLKILLENSMKFSHNVCRVVAETRVNNQNLFLTVRNFGPEIPETRLREIFQAVQDLHSPKKIGSGLYHASHIISQHRGSMWVESSKAEGTAFHFRFPLPVFNNCNQDRGSFMESDSGEIELNVLQDKLLHVRLKGIHDQYSIRKGCSEILAALDQKSYEGVIMDTSQVIGHWADACQMLATYFLPKFEQTSVRKCSWIRPESPFGRFCIQQVIAMNTTSIPVRKFASKEEALEWHAGQE